MEILNKTIKKLSDHEYQSLLSAVAGRKNNKPYAVLEAARHHNYDENKMMEMLGVNPSTYYTLKSRLNEKIAQYLSKNMENPISVLKEKVAMVPAMLFGNDREVSIRALKNLEKELIEYDLSNELITVYKALARLSMHNGDYDFYEREYNRHVAYSLAVVKAEDLFFEFTKCAGQYLLTHEERELELMQANLRELTNISELYRSHRLFVIYNVVRIYFLCITNKKENLQAIEMEVDRILQQIKNYFETYNLDTFYQSIRFIVDFLYFEYYTKAGNLVRAEHHYQIVNRQVGDISLKPVFSFYVARFLQAKVERFMSNSDLQGICDINTELEANFDTEVTDPYPFIVSNTFFAICKFYSGDYASSARIINNMRNELSLKKYYYTDIECKLFQAFNYCMIGEDGLCTQLLQSLKRQLADDPTSAETDEEQEAETGYDSADIFMKLLKAAIKPEEFRRKVGKVNDIYKSFVEANTGKQRILSFLRVDESGLRRLANPIKD